MQGLAGLFDLDDFPAFVMTALGAGAMRKFGLMTVGALGKRSRSEVIVSATEGRALLGVSPFGICHIQLPFKKFDAAAWAAEIKVRPRALLQLISQLAKCGPARIWRSLSAIAKLLIAIRTADGAKPLAIIAAKSLDRHSEQNLLAERIFKLHAFARVIADFSFCLVDGHFVGVLLRLQWAVQEVKRTRDRNLDRFETASTTYFDPSVKLADQTNVVNRVMATVMLTNEFGVPLGFERAYLPHFRAEVNFSGLKLKLKFQLTNFKIFNANYHGATLAPEVQPNRRKAADFACKRIRRKGYGSSKTLELKPATEGRSSVFCRISPDARTLTPGGKTILRTDIKDKGRGRAVSIRRATGSRARCDRGYGVRFRCVTRRGPGCGRSSTTMVSAMRS
jgi:hypothetical protein